MNGTTLVRGRMNGAFSVGTSERFVLTSNSEIGAKLIAKSWQEVYLKKYFWPEVVLFINKAIDFPHTNCNLREMLWDKFFFENI